MIFMKILVMLIPFANTINGITGIQVYENITNDTPTTTTKLAIVPTPIVNSNAVPNNATNESKLNSTEQNNQTISNNTSVDVLPEKTSRKKENENIMDGRTKVEQQEKTSSNVKHEKFVPSPEITLGGIEIQQPTGPQSKDNFYPMNQYYHPVKHSVHFHSSTPITSNSNWRHSSNLESLHKNYPKFEDEVQQQHKESEKFSLPPSSIDNSKWFYLPERPHSENTEKPSSRPSGSGKWKWVSDDEEEQSNRNANNYLPIVSSTVPSFPTNEFSYTYEIPSSDSSPFSFGSTKYEGMGIDQQLSGETPSTSTSLGSPLESEWESPFTSSNGKLKHKSKGRGKGNGISPWKKILHVLTAAIPIGLLISALTPQVIYVDPNSTSSISPSSNSLSLLSTTKHRSLDRTPVQLSDANDLTDSGRKFLSNPLMDFLHVLRDNGNSMERSDSCDDRKFCEASRSGAEPDANVLNKMLWKIANETPEFQARKSGLEHIFHAIRNNNCSIFECKKPSELSNHRQNYRSN